MIVVKIELWPNGSVTRAREISRVFITNIKSGDDSTSDYHVMADESGNESMDIPTRSLSFDIKDHDRNQSVFALLERVFAHKPDNT